MILEVRLRPEAEQDLSDAAAWYEAQVPGLGHRFLDEVLAAFSSVSETPLMYPVVHRNTRRALIHRFPFGVYFYAEAIEKANWEVRLHRCSAAACAARMDGKGKSRL
jgi:plasmid stabilization system protein ParE